MKDIIVIGGPNGAGKTTAAAVLLPRTLDLREFVNADEIARGLSPFNADGAAMTAGRIMLQRMRDLARSETSFAFETTCAGSLHARFLKERQREGWRVTLLFLWLDDPEIAIRRVARRVAEGGHAIPNDVIRRRYFTGLARMLSLYLPLSDAARIYDNTSGDAVLVASKRRPDGVAVHDRDRWKRLRELADEGHDGRGTA